MSTSETRAANRATKERLARAEQELAQQASNQRHSEYLQQYAQMLAGPGSNATVRQVENIANTMRAQLPDSRAQASLIDGEIPVITLRDPTSGERRTVWPDGRPFTRSEYEVVRALIDADYYRHFVNEQGQNTARHLYMTDEYRQFLHQLNEQARQRNRQQGG